jgi:hypothetical protein
VSEHPDMIDPYTNPPGVDPDYDPETAYTDEEIAEAEEWDREVRRIQAAANPHITPDPDLL